MDKKQCKNCGAPLKSLGWGKYKCEYCGTEYKEEDCFGEIRYIAVNTPPYKTLVAKTAIDDYWIRNDKDAAARYIVDSLSSSLVDTLKEYLRIEEQIDPMSCKRIYRGMIRVIPNDYRSF